MTKRVAVLASGQGTLLEAAIVAGVPIAKVYADRFCPAYNVVARDGKIPSSIFLRSFDKSFNRIEYTKWIIENLQADNIDLVVMMGWMTVFSADLFEHFSNRVLNSHPSLLPKFKGAHAVRDAMHAGVAITGTTIHIATAELDEGLILAQRAIALRKHDTEETLHERIKAAERKLYPKIILSYLQSL